ncbi:MAG: glycosyltransferase family 4 protein [Candidatus Heimdallarchaeota archaeon]
MRLLSIVSGGLFSQSISGISRREIELARAICKKGHEICMVVPKGFTTGYADMEQLNGIHFESIAFNKRPPRFWWLRHLKAISYPGITALKIRELQSLDPDIIYSSGAYEAIAGWIASRLTNLPHIPVLHDVISLHKPELWHREHFYRCRFRTAQQELAYKLQYPLILTVSQQSKVDLIKMGFPPQQIFVTGNGVDLDLYERVVPRSPRNPHRIVYVGRLEHHKQVNLLIKAVYVLSKEIHDLQLAIIGDGFLRAELEQLVYKLDLQARVKFYQSLTNEAVARCLKCSGILVFPSTWEGFGLPIVEGFATGCCVIARDLPVFREVIMNNQNGLLFSNYEDLLYKLRLVLLDDSLREKLAKYGKNTVKKYSWDRVAEKTLRILTQVIQHHS